MGNIAVGGTGKTPMTEYIIELLKNNFQIATLSRGYKRRTKGFTIADSRTTAIEIGDEPMQFHQKFPEVTVAVGEERLVAIPQILYQKPETEVIILDDAFQHRAVRAGLNIVLTDYNNLYTRDFMFPAGDLRDIRMSMKRADVIVITKCKSDLSSNEKEKVIREINPLSQQQVFFTTIQYDQPYHLFDNHRREIDFNDTVLLLCGIANPEPIKQLLNQKVATYEMIKYRDHHIFSSIDLIEIKKQYHKIITSKKIILTTEKDAVRLQKFKSEMAELPVFVLPVKHAFLFGEGEQFKQTVLNFIKSFKSSSKN